MGWRQGQGIGPKLTRRQKDRIQKSHVRLFGPTLPPGSSSLRDESDEENEEDDEFRFKSIFVFYRMCHRFRFMKRDDFFGLILTAFELTQLSSFLEAAGAVLKIGSA